MRPLRIARLTCDHSTIDGGDYLVVQALIKTLFDILILRKGPDSIPRSWLLVCVTAALWLLPMIVAAVLIPEYTSAGVVRLVASWLVSLACFMLVIVIGGDAHRMLQAMTAIIGCGALISIAQITSIVFLAPFLGATLAYIVAELLLYWSVYVKGHIMARTLDREWYIGLVISIAVFLVQYAFFASTAPSS